MSATSWQGLSARGLVWARLCGLGKGDEGPRIAGRLAGTWIPLSSPYLDQRVVVRHAAFVEPPRGYQHVAFGPIDLKASRLDAVNSHAPTERSVLVLQHDRITPTQSHPRGVLSRHENIMATGPRQRVGTLFHNAVELVPSPRAYQEFPFGDVLLRQFNRRKMTLAVRSIEAVGQQPRAAVLEVVALPAEMCNATIGWAHPIDLRADIRRILPGEGLGRAFWIEMPGKHHGNFPLVAGFAGSRAGNFRTVDHSALGAGFGAAAALLVAVARRQQNDGFRRIDQHGRVDHDVLMDAKVQSRERTVDAVRLGQGVRKLPPLCHSMSISPRSAPRMISAAPMPFHEGGLNPQNSGEEKRSAFSSFTGNPIT